MFLAVGGTLVTVSGTGFTAEGEVVNVVSFGGITATSVSVQNDTTLQCNVPPGTAGLAVQVTFANVNGTGLDGELCVAKIEADTEARRFVEKRLRCRARHVAFEPGVQLRVILNPQWGKNAVSAHSVKTMRSQPRPWASRI